jgi:hypothetical protein
MSMRLARLLRLGDVVGLLRLDVPAFGISKTRFEGDRSMVRRFDEHRRSETRFSCLGGRCLPGILATAALLLSSGCTRQDYQFGVKDARKDAAVDRVVPSTSDTGAASDAPADPFAGISAAKVLATLSFTRAVASTVMAGDNAIALFADLGLAMIDLSDPTAPVQGPALPTDGKVVAVEYDEEEGLAYAADITGKLYVFSALSTEGFAQLYETPVPALANKVLGMARLGATVHVLTGDSVVPVSFTFAGDRPTAATVGASMVLNAAASHIAAGGGALYLAFRTALQAWSVSATGAAAKLGEYPLAAEPRALLAKGSKVLVGMAKEGLATVDFGNPAAPAQLALDRALGDIMAARLFGRTLALGLERNLTVTMDLADFAAPRKLTVDQGPIPQFMAMLNGVLLRGTALSAQVVNIPPTVSASIPSIVANSFPLHGQIPVTFSKPIDPASANLVTLTCAGTAVIGQVLVALERTSLSFIPEGALPAGIACTLDLAAIKDASGLVVVQGSTVTVTTAVEASKPITNSGSQFTHVPDGTFTDFNPITGTNAGEWSDVTPAKGMYTYFYGDYKDGKLNILNDWFFNSEKIEPDCYNEFYVWTGGGSEQWTIRAYADRKVSVLKNGVVVEPSTGGVTGGAGYGPSPNVKEPHTIYELQIAALPGAWGVRLHDPGPTYSCKRLATEPSHIQGTLGLAGASSGVTIDSTKKPTAPMPATLLSPSNEASVGTVTPTLTWTAGSKEALNMLRYQVQISKVSSFASLLWNAGAMASSYTVPSGVLGTGKTYYWRIVASNAIGQAVSPAYAFTTGKRELPDAGFDAPAKEAGQPDSRPDVSVDRGLPDTSGEVGPQRGLTIEFLAVENGDAMGPGQGLVTSEPAGLKCTNGSGTCSAFFSVGSTITLNAVPAKGWHFVTWGGDCPSSLRTATGTLTMAAGDEPMNCAVRFDIDRPDGGTAGTAGSYAGSSGSDGGEDAAAGSGGTGGTDADVDSSSGDAGPAVLTGDVTALAGDSSYLYIGKANGGGIYRYSLSGPVGAEATLIIPGASVPHRGLAVGADYVYWIDRDRIMRASKNGVDAGVGGEALVSGETGLFQLGSNHRADDSKTAPTHLFWVSGSTSSAIIKTLPIAGGDVVTIANEVGMTANDRVAADTGNIYWTGTWHGSERVIYRSELAAGGPIQVGGTAGVTALSRFSPYLLTYMTCSSTDCSLDLRNVGALGSSMGVVAGLPANLTNVVGYAGTVLAYNASEVYRTTTALPSGSLYLSEGMLGDPYPSIGGFFYINTSRELHKLPMP